MPSATGSATGFRPTADFSGVAFVRSCHHAKHERTFDGKPTPRENPSVQITNSDPRRTAELINASVTTID